MGVWEDVEHLPAMEHRVERVAEQLKQVGQSLTTGLWHCDILGAPFCPAVYSPVTAGLSHHRAEALSSICLSYGRRGAERGPDCQHPFPGSHEQ